MLNYIALINYPNMKNHSILRALVCLHVLCSMAIAAEIPLRAPQVGEIRPSWWWRCWLDHIVVVDGEITYDGNADPELTITLAADSADKFFDAKTREAQKSRSRFRIAKLKTKKLLFSSPGIPREESKIESLMKGDAVEILVLLPVIEVNEHSYTELKSSDKGVYILSYSPGIIPRLNFVYNETIPEDGLQSAKKLFEYRSSMDSVELMPHVERSPERD